MVDVSDSGALKPACVPCTRDWTQKHSLPGLVPVDRALVYRGADGAYRAVCHCHGATCVVELGLETPSDNKIRTARAFA